MKINKEWHLAHRMPKNPTPKQRAEWHVEHAKNCGCRELTESIKKLITEQGLEITKK